MEGMIRDITDMVASEYLLDYRSGPLFWWLKTVIGAAALAGSLWGIVWILERAHWRDIKAREAEVSHIVLNTLSTSPTAENKPPGDGQLVVGSAVMSHDTVRSLSVLFRRIFGGPIWHYERLLVRARREALNRLRAEAVACGGQQVCGIRFQTLPMAGGRPIVAVIAFGTAY